MSTTQSFPVLLESFFTKRLMQQRRASPHTISSYRDSFSLLLHYAKKKLGKAPSQLSFHQIDAPLIAEFLNEMETARGISARSRNLRLTAIRSFFRFAAFEVPDHAAQIQRVLAIPNQRFIRNQVGFLTRPEVDALLAAPDANTWSGRRDHVLLLLAVQCGLRVSELTSIQRGAVVLGTGAHIKILGKGRKERVIPLTKQTVAVLKAWFREIPDQDGAIVFPSARGNALSADGVQYLLTKHVDVAAISCTLLQTRRITPHMLRHTNAMEMLQAGMDRSVIALWLGHESVETTQIYLEANMEMKEQALAKTAPPEGKPGRYRPGDQLMEFLKGL